MELQDALEQIGEIRQRMAVAHTFRGYRSLTTAFSGVVAVLGSLAQALWWPADALAFVLLWVTAAAVCVLVVAAEMWTRSRRADSPLQRDLSVLAIQQFVPCLVTGALLTLVLVRFAPEALWMLPGLWALLFSLGIYSSRRVLPAGTHLVGGFYLLAGLVCLALSAPAHVIWPWSMALIFGTGQFMAAGLLYWTLERSHGES